jgi:hypothetical protein
MMVNVMVWFTCRFRAVLARAKFMFRPRASAMAKLSSRAVSVYGCGWG